MSAVVLVEGALILAAAAGPAVPGSSRLDNRTHYSQQIEPSNTLGINRNKYTSVVSCWDFTPSRCNGSTILHMNKTYFF